MCVWRGGAAGGVQRCQAFECKSFVGSIAWLSLGGCVLGAGACSELLGGRRGRKATRYHGRIIDCGGFPAKVASAVSTGHANGGHGESLQRLKQRAVR